MTSTRNLNLIKFSLSTWPAVISSLLAFQLLASEPDSKVDASSKDGVYAEIQTNKGSIFLELFYKKTPLTVINFVGLAEGTLDTNKPEGTKFYDGLTFHRVINI